MDAFARALLLLGEAKMEQLSTMHVAVFGLGGVGGAAAEALARGGIGKLTLVDGDTFAESNLNRQLGALYSTLGQPKAEVWRRRIFDIAPTCEVRAETAFFSMETKEAYDFRVFDYVLDAIDSVTGKLLLIASAQQTGTPILSCMGTGNRFDPTAFRVGDVEETRGTGCGLARVMRKELRKRGLAGVQTVYSTESPQTPENPSGERGVPGSVSFVPPVAGMVMAGAAIRALAGVESHA